jgi:hypothetical protein
MDTRSSDLLRAVSLVNKLNEVLHKLGYATGSNLLNKLNEEIDTLFDTERKQLNNLEVHQNDI